MLTYDQLEKLSIILDAAANAWDLLSPWEREFVRDMQDKHIEKGGLVYVSPRQWAKLKQIADKVL